MTATSQVNTPTPLGAWLGQDYEQVAAFADTMQTGLTVTDDERIFVSFPRWGDEVRATVAEVVDGRAVPYPNADINRWSEGSDGADRLVSVQSVITDPHGHLWLLDTGSIAMAPWVPGGPKLVEVDPGTNSVVRTLVPAPDAITPTTYMNDVRFDFSRGQAGFAYVTDSQPTGGLIVFDLATGDSWAHLRDHATTRAIGNYRAMVQGKVREGYQVGADGIAISADGARLFYSPLWSRRLYSISTAALCDRTLTDAQVAQTIIDHGDKPASDGLESDTAGSLYATTYEHSAVVKVDADGTWTTLVHGPDILWPDTLALAANGYLYVSVNQLPRIPLFNNGIDERIPPYRIIRVRVDASPIRLGRQFDNDDSQRAEDGQGKR